jgi:NAD(P)-dependent dehydrogenase (short-subunit alcohol dehydrogenase family)
MSNINCSAVIIGASGGIGAALADALEAKGEFGCVHRVGRSSGSIRIDYNDPASIDVMAAHIATGPPPTLAIVATGVLHTANNGPEKATASLASEWMMANFVANAIGPALVAKAIIPLMPRGQRAVFAALSARVGSISDNRSGGWHSYRASKSALNQYMRTIAIDWARKHDQSVCVALHPGTVATGMSAPFQRGVPINKLFSTDFAAQALLGVVDTLTPAQTGRFFAWDSQEITP